MQLFQSMKSKSYSLTQGGCNEVPFYYDYLLLILKSNINLMRYIIIVNNSKDDIKIHIPVVVVLPPAPSSTL